MKKAVRRHVGRGSTSAFATLKCRFSKSTEALPDVSVAAGPARLRGQPGMNPAFHASFCGFRIFKAKWTACDGAAIDAAADVGRLDCIA